MLSKTFQQPYITVDSLPPMSQTLKLICRNCRTKATHDVGRIFADPKRNANNGLEIQFSNYFRCQNCGGPGPWDVADHLKLIGLTLKSTMGVDSGLCCGALELFDGTQLQTPAMAEEYLKDLIRKDPGSAFLHTRLGNLLRSCGLNEASYYYQEAIRLDPRDIEAHHHLNEFARREGGYRDVLRHSSAIVRAVVKGDPPATSDELMRFILDSALTGLRKQRNDFLKIINGDLGTDRVSQLIQRVLYEESEDEQVVQRIYEACLSKVEGRNWTRQSLLFHAEPASEYNNGYSHGETLPLNGADTLIRSLKELVERENLDPGRLSVAFRATREGKVEIPVRNVIGLYDGKRLALWRVESLQELFRGTQEPPPDHEMERYPHQYVHFFYLIERHLVTLCETMNPPTDEEFIGIFSAMRRRPEGRSLGLVHDAVWQCACLALGSRPYSEAEFQAVFGQLARSVRHWKEGFTSRNYISYLCSTMGE